MTNMSSERWKAARWFRPTPTCVFCDTLTEPTIVFCIDENVIRGWRCPKCGFALIHPNEIQKAMELLKQTMKIR